MNIYEEALSGEFDLPIPHRTVCDRFDEEIYIDNNDGNVLDNIPADVLAILEGASDCPSHIVIHGIENWLLQWTEGPNNPTFYAALCALHAASLALGCGTYMEPPSMVQSETFAKDVFDILHHCGRSTNSCIDDSALVTLNVVMSKSQGLVDIVTDIRPVWHGVNAGCCSKTTQPRQRQMIDWISSMQLTVA